MTDVKICPTCGTEYAEPKERFCPRDGSALRTHGGSQDLVGQIIGERYHVLRRLGEGGMGQVYLAEHVKMGRRSAVKVMHPGMVHDPDAISRFNREASNASRITHPHVAAIYDFGETADGIVYLAMELVDGEPLTAILERGGALPPARAALLVRQTADALGAAHELGIVHRDLKPDNIMVTRGRDGADCVKVVDFGIAKAGAGDNQKVTRTGLVVGTPEYMSPEQLAGDPLDGRSDVYALGLVAFNMLTGTLPFPSETAQEAMIMRLTDRPRTLAEMRADVAWPAAVQAAMDRALARDVRERYATAPEFARDLAAAVARMPGVAADEPTVVIDARLVPRTRVAGGAAARTSAMRTAEITQFTPVYTGTAPGARASRRRPALALLAAGLVAIAGAGAMYAGRGPTAAPAAATTGTARGGDTAVAPGTATAASGASVQPYSRETVRMPVVPAPDAAAPTRPAGGEAAPSDAGEREFATAVESDLQSFVARIDATNAATVLARTERQLARRLVSGPRRQRTMFVKAIALGALDRQDEGCATLRQLRRMPAFDTMDADFRQNVDLLLDAQSGSCQ